MIMNVKTICTDSIASKSVATYIASNSMVMQAKYIVGPRSMSKTNMQLENIFWNSIPDTRAQAAGTFKLWKLYCCVLSHLGNKSVLLREGAYPILTGNVT